MESGAPSNSQETQLIGSKKFLCSCSFPAPSQRKNKSIPFLQRTLESLSFSLPSPILLLSHSLLLFLLLLLTNACWWTTVVLGDKISSFVIWIFKLMFGWKQFIHHLKIKFTYCMIIFMLIFKTENNCVIICLTFQIHFRPFSSSPVPPEIDFHGQHQTDSSGSWVANGRHRQEVKWGRKESLVLSFPSRPWFRQQMRSSNSSTEDQSSCQTPAPCLSSHQVLETLFPPFALSSSEVVSVPHCYCSVDVLPSLVR